MVCVANLTGSTGGFNVSATVTAVVTNDQIIFTVENNSPGTLIDEFFFDLNGAFISDLSAGPGTRANWTFESAMNGVEPRDCGNFRYKFGTNVPAARIGNIPGVFVLQGPPGFMFTEALLGEVCVRFQQVGTTGDFSVCACGTFQCPPRTTTTTTAPGTTTTTQAPATTTTTQAPGQCPLLQPVADMEAALVQVLLRSVQLGNLDQIERILKLIIKKEILLELLLEECP